MTKGDKKITGAKHPGDSAQFAHYGFQAVIGSASDDAAYDTNNEHFDHKPLLSWPKVFGQTVNTY